MKLVYLFIFVFVAFSQANYAFSQNKDIEWLREINMERNQKLDPTFRVVDKSFEPIAIATPLTVFAIGLFKKDSTLTRKGLFIGTTFCVNYVVTVGMKLAINRPRPFETYPEIEQLSDGFSSSFPSGHASTAFAIATSLTISFPKWYVAVPSFLWASGVGYARMHQGVHYPSDVFVGAILGSGSAFACHWVNEKIKWERKRNWFL